jgi:calcium-translocating P-type ATPase
MTATGSPGVPAVPLGAPPADRVERLLRELKSNPAGLSRREAARRLAVQGPNTLPRPRRRHWLRDIVHQLTHPLALLLWGAALLAALTNARTLAVVILAVIGINALVALLQERQATRAIEALARYLPQQARVLRDGTAHVVAAEDIVQGDVLVVGEGDKVCADARLISGAVEVDLSALTGESAPVTRLAGAAETGGRLIDAPDAVFSGSRCTEGQCHAVVFATGSRTELGRIAVLSQHGEPEESPLERQVRHAAWVIAGAAIGIGLLFLPLGLLAGLSFADAAVFAVGLLVANVPEGLLPTITLALAVGVRFLARSGALVKRLSAVETLGSTTVICTDKTGTLTQNRMQVDSVWAGGTTVDDTGEPPAAVLWVMADCNEPDTTADPMESALRDFAVEHRVLAKHPEHVFAFDPRRKRMSVVARRAGELLVETKGAPEEVLPLCDTWLAVDGPQPFDDAARRGVLAAVDTVASRGLRVIALAVRPVPAVPASAADAERELRFVGLAALIDPPRPEVRQAVADCHRAGIRVLVITGDHGRTAAEIARQVGIGSARVVSGEQVDAMSDAALDRLLATEDEIVFSRSTPEAKLRIAEALRHRGETVAMTGDGVNDAPALHHADIGVAMGRSGTDVAREAATMVLTDDNFATIVAAIREGRRAYANLRKFVLYIFAHAVPEVVPFAIFALSAGAVPLPLTVLEILAVDLGTETLPALALGRELGEPDLMRRPPRPRSERLITGSLLTRAWLLMGTVSAVLAMGVFFAVLWHGGWHPGAATGAGDPLHRTWREATTVTFAAIVACQVGTAFAARTERAPLRAIGAWTNRALLAGIAAELAFAAAVIYLPPLQTLFGTTAPPAWSIAVLLPFPVVVWGCDEFARWRLRSR